MLWVHTKLKETAYFSLTLSATIFTGRHPSFLASGTFQGLFAVAYLLPLQGPASR